MTLMASAETPTGEFHQSWSSDSSTTAGDIDPSPEALSALIEAVAEHQDRRAFAALFDHFAPRIKGFIRRRGVEAAQAEDLAQDVMLTVWKRAKLYKRDQGTVSTWVFTIARNRHIDVIRRERRPEFDPGDPTLTTESLPEGDTVLSQAEIASRLRAAIDELPQDQVEVLKKNFFEDKPHSEIAIELGLPLGTVKSRVRLALAKLRQVTQDLEL
jgi:RNA polymerase sigma-70 factor (ECF subfamily)